MSSSTERPAVNRMRLNLLSNTTYQPEAKPEDYYSAITMTQDQMQEWDSRKIDYSDTEYIVTTLPQFNKKELQREGEAECLCTGWFKKKIWTTPGFPSPLVHPPKVVYEVRDSGHGLGVFATEDIEAGDMILAERPLLVSMIWNSARYRRDLSKEEMMRGAFANLEKNLEVLCERMSPETLKKYRSLYNSHETDGSGPLTGIWRTNGFDVGVTDPKVGKKGAYSAVGYDASRFNHSCCPNVVYNFNVPCFAMEIHAVRPIAKGEEMTVTYTGLMISAAERQTELKPYGFTCTCPACKDPETSDKERKRVIEQLLPKTSQGIKYAEEVLATFEATGLQSRSRYIHLLYRVANIHRKKKDGNKERADKLQAMADKVRSVRCGRETAEPSPPVKQVMIGSLEEMMQFIAQHEDPVERDNMIKAFGQVMTAGPLQGTSMAGPDGQMGVMYASDPISLSNM